LTAADAIGFPAEDKLKTAVMAAEKASGGRLGVSVLDSATGAQFSYRSGERFPLCSTFKLLLVTAVLCRVDRGEETLARRLAVVKTNILGNSSFSETRVASSASLAELAEAAITVSDNTAANLLLPSVGGPAGLTRFLRSLGDDVTRLDHGEPALGQSKPGDPRDTTSPDAMVATMRRILLADVLKPASRLLLETWLRTAKNGTTRLPAGFPADWQIGHKTGTGAYGTANDVAILWPPGRPPLIVASYLTESTVPEPQRDATHAAIAKAIAASF
jgi:beta-lactamase class A